jgi:hypothetical protein
MVSAARCGSVRVVSRAAVQRPAFSQVRQRLTPDVRPVATACTNGLRIATVDVIPPGD